MSSGFDPYRKWLGIKSPQRPVDYYSLLGIEQFEERSDVIDAAAMKRVELLQDIATGSENVELSQKVLNEISTARLCLMDADKRARYNLSLQKANLGMGSAEERLAKLAKRDDAQQKSSSAESAPQEMEQADTPDEVPELPVVNIVSNRKSSTKKTTVKDGTPKKKSTVKSKKSKQKTSAKKSSAKKSSKKKSSKKQVRKRAEPNWTLAIAALMVFFAVVLAGLLAAFLIIYNSNKTSGQNNSSSGVGSGSVRVAQENFDDPADEGKLIKELSGPTLDKDRLADAEKARTEALAAEAEEVKRKRNARKSKAKAARKTASNQLAPGITIVFFDAGLNNPKSASEVVSPGKQGWKFRPKQKSDVNEGAWNANALPAWVSGDTIFSKINWSRRLTQAELTALWNHGWRFTVIARPLEGQIQIGWGTPKNVKNKWDGGTQLIVWQLENDIKVKLGWKNRSGEEASNFTIKNGIGRGEFVKVVMSCPPKSSRIRMTVSAIGKAPDSEREVRSNELALVTNYPFHGMVGFATTNSKRKDKLIQGLINKVELKVGNE